MDATSNGPKITVQSAIIDRFNAEIGNAKITSGTPAMIEAVLNNILWSLEEQGIEHDLKLIRKEAEIERTEYYEIIALVDEGPMRVTKAWPLLIPDHITYKKQEVRSNIEYAGHRLVKLLEIRPLFKKR